MKQVFSNILPIVKAGKNEPITVTQSLDNRLTQEGPGTVHVRIDGPQTSLLADMISGVFPAPGSEISPDEFLPHIALSRRTLPWEREGPNALETTPWLALLLFRESELKSPTEQLSAPAVSVKTLKVQNIPDLTTRNRLMNTLQVPGETEVSTLTVSNAILRNVIPTQAELPLLCHVKRSDASGRFVDSAIVLSNRLPNANAPSGQDPQIHLAALVSVERAPELFTLPLAGTTTLLVLHHWTFRPSQGGDFEQVMKSIAYRPHGGVMRFGNMPAPVSQGETAPLSGGFKALVDKDGYFLTPVEHDQDVSATYRSPLHPFGPQPRSPHFAISAAPNEFATVPPGGAPLDFSHAAAFELGRLLALNDPAILEDLRDIRAVVKPLEPPVAVNKLPNALQKFDWVVNPAWIEQPWEGFAGQSLVKDETAFLDKGVADVTGVLDHVATWNLNAIVSAINQVGPAMTPAVTAINVTTVTEDALGEQFAEVVQAANG